MKMNKKLITIMMLGCIGSFGLASANTIECKNEAVGEKVNGNYLVVEDGAGEYGIKKASNLGKILSGALKVCTSHVTNMNHLFDGALWFNQDISDWDVSKVRNMSSMFRGAKAFNQDISIWDVSKVFDMSRMFNEAQTFNQNINSWNVSNVEFYDDFATGSLIEGTNKMPDFV